MSDEITHLDEQRLTERDRFRAAAAELEQKMRETPGALIGDNDMNPLKHSFAGGFYIREMAFPANELAVTKIHKHPHPFFLKEGEISVATEDGVKKVKAPFWGITPAGTQRMVYTHTSGIFITIHETDETDLEKIEEEVIAKDWDEMDKILSDGEGMECLS